MLGVQPLFSLALQLKPDKVYYVGGFGVLSKWLPVSEYEVNLVLTA